MKHHPYAARAPRLPDGDRLDPSSLLGGKGGPLELEVGPGRGGFVFERLAAAPTIRMLGFEIRLKWASLVDERLREQGLSERARVFAEDARPAIARFPDTCLDVVFVHFPDPWWKKRHHKRLVVGKALLAELSRTLRPGGQVFLQTDVEERALGYEQLFSHQPPFAPFGPEARVDENPFLARSPRERRALSDGLPIFRLHYRKL
jgi:tRNA (guanine-N7-)-methyltransferase